jgi:hypothetical protein
MQKTKNRGGGGMFISVQISKDAWCCVSTAIRRIPVQKHRFFLKKTDFFYKIV